MLTNKQREIIEQSTWVVDTALKRLGYKDNDLRQMGLCYMCRCMLSFDPDYGVKWTTYAFKSVYLYLKRTIKKENLRLNNIVEGDIYDFANFLEAKTNEEDRQLIDIIKTSCNETERCIIDLKMQGLTTTQIGKKMDLNNRKVLKNFYKIKQKAIFIRETTR